MRYLLEILLVITMMIIGWVLVPILLLFKLSDKRVGTTHLIDQRLPKWAAWFDVGDELDRQYGLNGDFGYQKTELEGKEASTFDLYMLRCKWLAFRNPVNGLKYKLGAETINMRLIKQTVWYQFGANKLPIGDWTNAGLLRNKLTNGKRTYSEFYLIYKYPFVNKCLRLRFGHKFGQEIISKRGIVSWVFVISPFKKYIGYVPGKFDS